MPSSPAIGLSFAGRAYLWACERLYHEFAWAYDAVAWGVSLGAWDSWRAAAFALCPPGPLLELGYGTGALLAHAARQGRPVVGVERSPQMERAAGRRLARAGGHAVVRARADAQVLPFAAGSFACVLATFPAPYVTEQATLAEVARVLQPGGLLVVGGLWVRPRARLLRSLPVVYGPPAARSQQMFGARLVEAGLRPHWREIDTRGGAVGILIAVRDA